MNKLLLRSLVLVVMIFVFTSLAFARGPASVYIVGLNKLELWNGTGWVTVFDAASEGASATLDIASASSGATMGNFLSGLNVPDGTYTKCRVTPSTTFTYSGYDGIAYTTAGTGINGGSSPTETPGLEKAYTVTLTGANIPAATTSTVFPTPITVLNGVADHNVRVSFDVSQGIVLRGAGQNLDLWPYEPTVTMTVVNK